MMTLLSILNTEVWPEEAPLERRNVRW